MDDERLERLLRGYHLPEPPPALDRRVLDEGGRILARARAWHTVAGIARGFAGALGFGYVTAVIDLITATDVEYHVDLI